MAFAAEHNTHSGRADLTTGGLFGREFALCNIYIFFMPNSAKRGELVIFYSRKRAVSDRKSK
jgi:hypothetical protein